MRLLDKKSELPYGVSINRKRNNPCFCSNKSDFVGKIGIFTQKQAAILRIHFNSYYAA
ncbi:MAG: hypothetical protein LBB59_00940 [Campylobacteraceae bacterium]|nr:hypothetical protein [Campylobacteraceae bacterium]